MSAEILLFEQQNPYQALIFTTAKYPFWQLAFGVWLQEITNQKFNLLTPLPIVIDMPTSKHIDMDESGLSF